MLRLTKNGGKYGLNVQMRHQQLIYPRENSFFTYHELGKGRLA